MVTGDNHTTAAAVAQSLGIAFEAEVLPAQKSDAVKRYPGKRSGRGDGGRRGQRRARLWPKPTSVSPWAQEPMSRWSRAASSW